MPETTRVVLSGGPGTGKTSILQVLENRGQFCHHEVSREIIKRELEKGSDVLPWKNLPAFSELVINGRLAQFKNAQKGLNFYDRSIIDSIAYMHKDKAAVKADWKKMAIEYRYATKVFVTGPWREIFENDFERRESWPDMLHIHEYIVSTYADLGYQVVLVPKLDLQERADFVLNHVNV